MEKIDEQLNNLSVEEIPTGIHQSVMKKIHYSRLVPMLLIVFGLLILNFLIIAWHINVKLINAEFIDMMQDFFDVFNFNFSFVNTALISFLEIISPALILSAVLSLIGVIYIGKKINLYRLS